MEYVLCVMEDRIVSKTSCDETQIAEIIYKNRI